MITKLNKAHPHYHTKELCQLFCHSRSSYYYQVKERALDGETKSILHSIKQISLETGYTYGKRRLRYQLNQQGYRIGMYKTATLMKKANIVAIRPKRRHGYPNIGKAHQIAKNLLNRDFHQYNKHTHWVGDMTYIKTYQGWSYLASVLDLATKKVVGWSLSKQPNAELAKQAIVHAINRYQPNTTKLMFHSDQGVQYSSKAFVEYCDINKITQSMSRRGNCWDNSVMERFFRSLKTEKLNHLSFTDHDEVIKNVESYIYFYNYKRIHSAIGYLTPAQKMAGLM